MVTGLASRAGLRDRCQLFGDAHLQAGEDEGDALPAEVVQELPEPQHHGVVHAADAAALQDRTARRGRCGDRPVPLSEATGLRPQREGQGTRYDSHSFPQRENQPLFPHNTDSQEKQVPRCRCWGDATLLGAGNARGGPGQGCR